MKTKDIVSAIDTLLPRFLVLLKISKYQNNKAFKIRTHTTKERIKITITFASSISLTKRPNLKMEVICKLGNLENISEISCKVPWMDKPNPNLLRSLENLCKEEREFLFRTLGVTFLNEYIVKHKIALPKSNYLVDDLMDTIVVCLLALELS